MNNLKFVSNYILSICFTFVLYTTELEGQIINGGFEDWYFVEENKEYPVGWDQLLLNGNEAITKSTNAQEGLYAVSIASLNFLDGTYSPAHLGSKYIPTDYNLKFSFYYLIDSIEAQSNAVVEFYQRNSEGEYRIFKSEKFNEVSPNYIHEEINISIEILDTIFIVLIAENEPKPVGHDGFIRVMFDNVSIEQITNTHNALNSPCKVNSLTSDNYIRLSEICYSNAKYVLFSSLGQVISEGSVLDDNIVLPYNGIYLLSLKDETNDNKIFKVIKH